ncbi:hypothetical protein PDIG_15180 [Penicillium digitatum PHI26]|uniref:Uncharacterized protein n=2 Tax=Penicillium digitatum TaxID=36651 RepID=K9G7S6_PEND2|nr:hypothetical protein PDIP_30700 [Penicillium digitatum Pd1]EKV17394.1 hypothetical protein PDIG_15180 [Penicillium digitatum PHI26]EKV17657.1 hypothetical protein PDIP_30700 [Penicillium digitatum Pd1]
MDLSDLGLVVADGQTNAARVMFVKRQEEKLKGNPIHVVSLDPGATLPSRIFGPGCRKGKKLQVCATHLLIFLFLFNRFL